MERMTEAEKAQAIKVIQAVLDAYKGCQLPPPPPEKLASIVALFVQILATPWTLSEGK